MEPLDILHECDRLAPSGWIHPEQTPAIRAERHTRENVCERMDCKSPEMGNYDAQMAVTRVEWAARIVVHRNGPDDKVKLRESNPKNYLVTIIKFTNILYM